MFFEGFFFPILYFTDITRIVYSASRLLPHTPDTTHTRARTHTHTHTHPMLMNPCWEKVRAGLTALLLLLPKVGTGWGTRGHLSRPWPNLLLARLPCPASSHHTPIITLYIMQSFWFPPTRLPKYHLQKVTLAVIILFVSLCKKKRKEKKK